MGVVALVMGGQRLRRAQDLVVAAVAADHVQADDDRLLALVRHHDALAHLRAAGAVLGGVVRLGGRLALAPLGVLGLDAGAVGAALGGLALALGEALGVTLLGRARRALARLDAALGALGLELLAARGAGLRGGGG